MSNDMSVAGVLSVALPVAGSLPVRGGGTADVPVQAVAPVPQGQAGSDVLAGAARQVVQAMPGSNRFDFSFDKQIGMTIVKVYNNATGELVRQIPTEEVVRIAQLMRQEEAHPQVLDVTA
jgi:flagellar protein FlaG